MKAIILYARYVSVCIRCRMAYRISFLLAVLSRFLVAFCGVIALSFLFSGFEHIKGYTYTDVLLCYAAMEMSFSLSECLSSGFAAFASMIKSGGFDTVLVHPRSPILQIMGMGFDMERIGAAISALVTLGIVLGMNAIDWTLMRLMTLLMMILGGTVLFSALFLIGAAICFFAVEESSALNLFTYGGKEHGKYPIDVYGKGLFRLCTFVIPYTLVQYYPLQVLLGRSDQLLYTFFPLGAFLFWLAAYAFWRVGVRHYASTGS